jgi:hypothetical protein
VLGEHDDGPPVVWGFGVAEVEKDFGEEAGVELVFVIAVALVFEKEDRAFGRLDGFEDAVAAEASLFDFVAA